MPSFSDMLRGNPRGWGMGPPSPEEGVSVPREPMTPGQAALRLIQKRIPYEATPENAATIGLSALPMGRALSLAAKPTMAAILAGATSTPAGSEEPTALKQLYQEQARASKRREDALLRRETERKSGEGPRFQAAESEVTAATNELQAINKLIESENRKNSPEYALEMAEKRKAAEEAERKRVSETPTRELYSDIAPYIPVATGALGMGMGALLRGKGMANFNAELKAITDRWGEVANAAKISLSRGNVSKAAQLQEEALVLQQQFEALKKAGASGKYAPSIAGATLGVEGAFLPEEIDLARASPGSALQKKLYDSVLNDPAKTAERAVFSAIAGGLGPAEIASKATGSIMSRAMPRGFAAETASMASVLRNRGTASPPASTKTQRAVTASPTAQNTALPPTTPPAQIAPPSAGTTTSVKKPRGGSHPDHEWDAKSGRWKDVDGKYLSGPPPKE
jgi:hypothetical protein